MIPAEAVEAGARGVWRHYEAMAASNTAQPSDEDREVARAALAAAAPYILAAAEESVVELGHEEWCDAYTSHAGACRCLKAKVLEILSIKAGTP